MSDIRSAKLTASGTVVATRPSRLMGVYFVAGATAGSITIKDGGASGTTIFDMDTAASSYGYILVPRGGIRAMTDLYATITNITSLTVLYD